MRVAIVGLGGVGGYICAMLSKSSLDVVGFARGAHLEKIKKDGIQIIEDEKKWIASIDAKSLEDTDAYFDVVIFCVKSYDLKESYEAMKNHIDAKSIIFSLSNGVGSGDELRKWSKSIVLDSCVYIISHIQTAGVIRKKGNIFAFVCGGDAKGGEVIKSIFDTAGLRAKVAEDIKEAIWKKYIFISAFATLTSYYDKSMFYIYENHFDEAKALLQEIASVAFAKKINIQEEVQKALEIASKLPSDSSTSMHLDFKNKKKVELETLSKYIVDEAKIFGVKTPLMNKMYEELNSRL
ncbi:ketopantoate reductase family protein [Sulfurimonas sp.]|uniref:ketopantoate reductase family protein n=1 Tax=Sulfurimonas sp. TaxID=2022749 RepID=UPI002B47DEBA|nr:ketopantoate reductase family protein [Sulfurimonas sp.]